MLVNFWNPHCPPCIEEQPVLQDAWQRLRDDGVAVIGMMYVGQNWPDDREAARRHIRRFGVTYPNLVDESSRVASALGVVGIPTSIVADRSGRVVSRFIGKLRRQQLDEAMRRALSRGG